MLSIQQLIDDAKCYDIVCQEQWPDGVRCPHCESDEVVKRGRHSAGEYARDDDGDGFCEGHVNTMEGVWSLLRS